METLIPYFTTKVGRVSYTRERLELDDGDFLDLDWLKSGAKDLIIISHGLEGNSKDHFIEQSVSALRKQGYDILVWHYRSCSSEMNRLPRFYDHGDIQDLHEVIQHAGKSYQNIKLVGFSMGGTMVINYLGSDNVDSNIKKAIVISAPIDLQAASENLNKGLNKFLEKSFLKKWKRKIRLKAINFPNLFDLSALERVTTLVELYRYLIPLHGYETLGEYYEKWSCEQYLSKIDIPLLIVNAVNDPMLSRNCYPVEACKKSETVFLEIPKYGGHTGFTKRTDGKLWYVWRTEQFLS